MALDAQTAAFIRKLSDSVGTLEAAVASEKAKREQLEAQLAQMKGSADRPYFIEDIPGRYYSVSA